MTIPKITHQIWMQGWDNFPEKFQKNVDSLHEKNPGFQHMKWDEKSLRKECLQIGKECAERFDSFELLISKVDFGRYVVLYNYGGISVDTDMFSLRSINDTPHINESKFIVSYQTYPYNYFGHKNNAVIICEKNHEILMNLINTIIKDTKKVSYYMTKEVYVGYSTGPIIFDTVVSKYKNDIKVIDYKYYEPCNSSDPYCKIPNETIMDHQHEMSWMNPLYKLLNTFLFFLLHNIIYIIIFIILLFIFIYKYKKIIKLKIFKMGR